MYDTFAEHRHQIASGTIGVRNTVVSGTGLRNASPKTTPQSKMRAAQPLLRVAPHVEHHAL